ncbi:CL2DB protein, partial [Anthoscopus minutus]|nr:CL2DB protein [Anthoscopus minutus]
DFALRCTRGRKAAAAIAALAVGLLLSAAIAALAARKNPPCSAAAALPGCLESGIGFGKKCFYFLEEEADWEGSQRSCLSRQAQLATIDTQEELVKRKHPRRSYGNFMEFWVGLRREGSGPWKWLNGS